MAKKLIGFRYDLQTLEKLDVIASESAKQNKSLLVNAALWHLTNLPQEERDRIIASYVTQKYT